MRTRPAKSARTVTVALIILAVGLTEGCRHCPPSVDGSRLDIRLTVLESPDRIEQTIRSSLTDKYSATCMTDGYTMYQATNGLTRWVFVQAFNAPRGLNMFNVYCYEQQQRNEWLLRAYVPIYGALHTNSLDRRLDVQTDGGYINVAFRSVIVFTTASPKASTEGVPHKR